MCLGPDQRLAVEGGEVELCLSRAVEKWCDWGEWEGERETGEEERALYFLRVTAELCRLTCQVGWSGATSVSLSLPQFSLAGRCLWVLGKIHSCPPVHPVPGAYQLALSASCLLFIRGGFAREEFCSQDLEERLSGAVCELGQERGSDLTVSHLSCRLALASLHLQQRKVPILLS